MISWRHPESSPEVPSGGYRGSAGVAEQPVELGGGAGEVTLERCGRLVARIDLDYFGVEEAPGS